ncbi:MAG: hypothetical protein WCB51_04265 [Candidatus Dormiibacterota bacterium]
MTAQLSAGADITSIQVDLLATNEYYRDVGSNPVDFVTRVYDDVLEHDPTPVEMADALAIIGKGSDANARSRFAQDVVMSAEARAVRVDTAFHALLKRYPDSAELALWVNRLPGSLNGGVSGAEMVAQIAASAEFYARNGDVAARFLAQLYADLLNRPPTSAELSSDSVVVTQANAGSSAVRSAIAENLISGSEFRHDEITSFFETYLRPTCPRVASQECAAPLQNPSPSEMAAAMTALASGATEESIIASVVGSDAYYEKQGSTQAGFIRGVYQDLLGRAPSNAEMSAALSTYSNDSTGHASFAQAMTNTITYQDLVVSLDYQQLLLRIPFPAELNAGQRLLAGDFTSLQPPDEVLLGTIMGTPEYFADTGGTDTGFVAGVIGSLLLHPGTAHDVAAYQRQPLPHDSGWRSGVVASILDGNEYRTDFIRGVYEQLLSVKVCSASVGSQQPNGGALAKIAIVLVIGVLLGGFVVAIGVPAILRRRG